MKIQAIGMIETKGLIGAIVGADAMVKSANVEIVGNKYFKVRSGIVTVIVTGDVGAVKSAIEIGANEASKVGTLITSHTIARPDEFVMKMILPKVYEEVKAELKKEKVDKLKEEVIKQEEIAVEKKQEEVKVPQIVELGKSELVEVSKEIIKQDNIEKYKETKKDKKDKKK